MKKIYYGILGIFIALGIYSTYNQLKNGLIVTGLGEPVVWGLYIINYTFFLGLGAGILILTSMDSIRKKCSSQVRFIFSISAFISIILAVIFINLDIGRIDRFYYFLIYPQLQSPLFWDFISVQILLIISIVYSIINLRNILIKIKIKENSSSLLKIFHQVFTHIKPFKINIFSKYFHFVMILLIAGIYLTTTEIFTSIKAHPDWHTPTLGFIFLVSAIFSGLAVLMFLESIYDRTSNPKEKSVFFKTHKKIMLYLVIINIVEISFLLLRYTVAKEMPITHEVINLFPFSILIFLFIGNFIPIILAFKYEAGNHENIYLYRLIAIIIFVMSYIKRDDLIISGYVTRWLPFASNVSYLPTLPEILIVLGVYSIGILFFIIVFHLIKTASRDKVI